MANVFNEKVKMRHTEERPVCNPEEFKKVVEARRSVRVYTEEKIPEEIVRECLRLTLLAPNSSNLQPWAFYWVRDPNKKAALAKACMNQMAARTAAELFVCVAEPYRWKEHCKEMIESLGKMGQPIPKVVTDYYTKLAPLVYTQGWFSILGFIRRIIFWCVGWFRIVPREPNNHADMDLWASKTVALACENLMLAFVSYNYDTCPMEGFDAHAVKKILGLKRKDKVVMVVSAGRRAPDGVYGPQLRFDSKKFIREV